MPMYILGWEKVAVLSHTHQGALEDPEAYLDVPGS